MGRSCEEPCSTTASILPNKLPSGPSQRGLNIRIKTDCDLFYVFYSKNNNVGPDNETSSTMIVECRKKQQLWKRVPPIPEVYILQEARSIHVMKKHSFLDCGLQNQTLLLGVFVWNKQNTGWGNGLAIYWAVNYIYSVFWTNTVSNKGFFLQHEQLLSILIKKPGQSGLGEKGKATKPYYKTIYVPSQPTTLLPFTLMSVCLHYTRINPKHLHRSSRTPPGYRFHRETRCQKDVGRFHVTMCYTVLMQKLDGFQKLSHTRSDLEKLLSRCNESAASGLWDVGSPLHSLHPLKTTSSGKKKRKRPLCCKFIILCSIFYKYGPFDSTQFVTWR